MGKGFLPPEQPHTLKPSEIPSESLELSSVEADAQVAEQLAEQEETFLEQPSGGSGSTVATTSPQTAVSTGVPVVKDEVTLAVEKILERDLGEYVQALPEDQRARFQKKGQEVADEIAKMVRELHLQVKRVLTLIRDWLLTLPGMNKFFLEQEAKIKTDQMLELERVRREDKQNRP